MADAQRRGRGRLGRSWVAPSGSSLLFSLVLRRSLPPIVLTAASSVAAATAIQSIAGVQTRVKWPNDVMVADRKVCGVLTDVVIHGAERIAVVGIGLNVNLDPMAAGLPRTATSLSDQAGRPFSRQEILAAILAGLDGCFALDDEALTKQVWDRWQGLLWRRHQTVRVDRDGTTVEGVVEGLSPSGGLLIRRVDGSIVEVTTGDLSTDL